MNQQINKRGDKLNSEQFLDLLAKICCLLDDSFYKDKKGSFIKLIKVYILPFYLKKYNKENKGSKFYCDETFNQDKSQIERMISRYDAEIKRW